MIAMDFGNGDKLCLHDSKGERAVPSRLYRAEFRGMRSDLKFAKNLEMLLADDDVVCESATVGSSGADPELVRDVVGSAPNALYTISGRMVKNHLKDHGLTREKITDAEAAEIIYGIAVSNPDSLQLWRFRTDRLVRLHKSVRPLDKRDYKDPMVDFFMSRLPAFESLGEYQQWLWGDTGGKKYSPSRVLPFAMAFDETGWESRIGYERIIGLYGHGYKSFYRRATVVLMQRIAKDIAGTTRIGEVSKQQRKEAWRAARREIRRLYHLARQGTGYPDQGTMNPVSLVEAG